MGAFDFFFSLYGMILGLSVAVIAGGVAAVFEFRRSVRIGYLTPLLATFVMLDIASFWETAWTSLRKAPFSYGLLIVGMAISITYYIAASLVFPRSMDGAAALDDHFWRNKRPVLLLTACANLMMLTMVMCFASESPDGARLRINYAITGTIYALLILPAAFSERPRVIATLIGLHVALYVAIGAISFVIATP